MIVVIGSLTFDAASGTALGRTAAIAKAVARHERSVEVVARIGDDAVGDALLLALARDGVGHVTVLREAGSATAMARSDGVPSDPERSMVEELLGQEVATQPLVTDDAPRLQPSDVALALEYLDGIDVVVVDVGGDVEALDSAVAGAEFHGAHVIALTPGRANPPATRAAVTELLVPPEEQASALPAVVATLAVAIQDGADVRDQLRTLTSR